LKNRFSFHAQQQNCCLQQHKFIVDAAKINYKKPTAKPQKTHSKNSFSQSKTAQKTPCGQRSFYAFSPETLSCKAFHKKQDISTYY